MHTNKGLKNRASPITRLVAVTAAALYASAVIGPDGGELHLPGAGLRISIPHGALAEPTTISVSAHQDVYGFSVSMPTGTTLAKRARVEQHITEHSAINELVFGHIADDGTCDAYYAARNEHGCAVAYVSSFSGYLLASGAQEGMACDPTVITDGTCVWVDDGGPEDPR
jgi:hypothetical protein